MTRRVAIVLAAVGGADGAGHAERLLGRTDGTGRDDPDSELGDLVRRAVEDPAALDPGDRQALEVEFGWPLLLVSRLTSVALSVAIVELIEKPVQTLRARLRRPRASGVG